MTPTGHAAPTVLPTLSRPWAPLFARLYHRAGSVLLSPHAPRRVLGGLVAAFWVTASAVILVVAFVGSVQ